MTVIYERADIIRSVELETIWGAAHEVEKSLTAEVTGMHGGHHCSAFGEQELVLAKIPVKKVSQYGTDRARLFPGRPMACFRDQLQFSASDMLPHQIAIRRC